MIRVRVASTPIKGAFAATVFVDCEEVLVSWEVAAVFRRFELGESVPLVRGFLRDAAFGLSVEFFVGL